MDPTQLGDKEQPFAEASIQVRNTNGTYRTTNIVNLSDGSLPYATIKVHDNKTPTAKLVLDLKVDGYANPICQGECGKVQSWGTNHKPQREGKLDVFRFSLQGLSEGSHVATFTVFDEACNKTTHSVNFNVVYFGSDLPEDKANPPSMSLETSGTLQAVTTTSPLKIKFSEPVVGVSAGTLVLERAEGGGFVPETARVIGPLGDVTVSQRVSEVNLILPSRLKASTNYRISAADTILDLSGTPLSARTIPFTTAGYQSLPSLDIPKGKVSDIAAIGNMVYVAVEGKIHAYTFDGTSWASQGQVGPSAQKDFFGQDVVRVRAFQDVPLAKGSVGHLLLVTTSPKPGVTHQQNALWGFRACGAPDLYFGTSLGPTSSGYSPSLDCMNGIISAGRLTSSVALIDTATALKGWEDHTAGGGTPLDVLTPQGANQAATVQSFYMADPKGTEVPANWGVGLLPDLQASGTPRTGVAVGYLGSRLRGMPNSLHEGLGGYYTPKPPFQGEAGGVDTRTIPVPLDGRGVTRLAILPGATIADPDGSNPRTTTLAIGLSGSNRLEIVDESDPANPKPLGSWKAPGPILYRMPAVDPTTQLVAIPVQKTYIKPGTEPVPDPNSIQGFSIPTTTETVWMVLSLSDPSKPSVVAEVPRMGNWGVVSSGRLYTSDGMGKVSTVDLSQSSVGVRLASEYENKPNMRHAASPYPLACQATTRNISIYAVSINQGVEKVIDTIGVSATDPLKIDLALPHKNDVPVVAERRGVLKIWLQSMEAIAASVVVRVSITSAIGTIPSFSQTVSVRPGLPSLYDVNNKGGVAEFFLTEDHLQYGTLNLKIEILDQATSIQSHTLTQTLSEASEVNVYIIPLVPNWGDPATTAAGTFTPAEEDQMVNTLRLRYQSYFPVSTWENQFRVTKTPPPGFGVFTLDKSEGFPATTTDPAGTLGKAFHKFTVQVRRWQNLQVPVPGNKTIKRFVLAVKPVVNVTHIGDIGLGGLSQVPLVHPTAPSLLDFTPASMCVRADLAPIGMLTSFRPFMTTVDSIFVHEVGHTFGRYHSLTSFGMAAGIQDAAQPEAAWPGENPTLNTSNPNSTSKGQKNWGTPGTSRYGDGNIGIAGWDGFPIGGGLGLGVPIPFNSKVLAGSRYTVMSYAKSQTWASDFDWSVWWKLIKKGVSSDQHGESYQLMVVPERAYLPVDTEIPLNAKTNFFDAMGKKSNTYDWPCNWSLRPGSSGTIIPGSNGAVSINYKPPRVSSGVQVVEASTIDPVLKNDPDLASATARITVGTPVIRPKAGSIQAKVHTTDAVPCEIVLEPGGQLLAEPDTTWSIFPPPGCTVPAATLLAPARGGSSTFYAPSSVWNGIIWKIDDYLITASNPAFSYKIGNVGQNPKTTIRVRDIKLDLVLPSSGAASVMAGQALELKARASGGWSDELDWSFDSNPTLGVLTGADSTRTFTAGQTKGTTRVRVASKVKPSLYKIIEITVQ